MKCTRTSVQATRFLRAAGIGRSWASLPLRYNAIVASIVSLVAAAGMSGVFIP